MSTEGIQVVLSVGDAKELSHWVGFLAATQEYIPRSVIELAEDLAEELSKNGDG